MGSGMSVGHTNHIDFTPLRQWNKGGPTQLKALKDRYVESVNQGRTDALTQLEEEAARLAKDNFVQKLINCVTSNQSKESFIKAVLVAHVLSNEKNLSEEKCAKLRQSVIEIYSHCPSCTIDSATVEQQDGVDVIAVPVGTRNLYFGRGILGLDVELMGGCGSDYNKFRSNMLAVIQNKSPALELSGVSQSGAANAQTVVGRNALALLSRGMFEAKLDKFTSLEMRNLIKELDVRCERDGVFQTCIGSLDVAAANEVLKYLFGLPVYLQKATAPWAIDAHILQGIFNSACGCEMPQQDGSIDLSNDLKQRERSFSWSGNL